nr:dienelactone hydrolase family protein [Corynebacterium sp. TAE3-ERU12]
MNKLVSKLSKRGPHNVLVGDLSYVGLPGAVYTPDEGTNLPAIVWGHDWREPVQNYHATLRHLASWGICVAAPDTENGFLADHRGLAADMESALQVLAGVRLGTGEVTVHPSKIGFAGHGMGAGCAALAAAGRDHVAGVACVYPANTAPPADAAATNIHAPGLILAPEDNEWLDRGNPARMAVKWAGDVCYRKIEDTEQNDFSESPLLRRLLGVTSSDRKKREFARAILTGWILEVIAGLDDYAGFSDPSEKIKNSKGQSVEFLRETILVPGASSDDDESKDD